MNTFFDTLGNDVWNGAFRTSGGVEVWAGLVIVVPDPDRLYITLGLYRTISVGLGIAREVTVGTGVARTVRIEVER